MTRLIRLEIRKLSKPVLAVTAALTVLLSVLSCTVFQGYSLVTDLDKWVLGAEFLGLLFPLFVTVPVCWQLYYERRDRFLVYTLPRVTAGRYIVAKYIACAVCAFAVIFLPLVISALAALYLAPEPQWGYLAKDDAYLPAWTQMLGPLYMSRPALYVLLLSAWKGLLGVISMTLGFVLALYGNNIFVVLTGPFIYAILDHFVWGLGGYYSLTGAFAQEYMKHARPLRAIWGPVQALLFCGLTALFYAKVKKRRVYPL